MLQDDLIFFQKRIYLYLRSENHSINHNSLLSYARKRLHQIALRRCMRSLAFSRGKIFVLAETTNSKIVILNLDLSHKIPYSFSESDRTLLYYLRNEISTF